MRLCPLLRETEVMFRAKIPLPNLSVGTDLSKDLVNSDGDNHIFGFGGGDKLFGCCGNNLLSDGSDSDRLEGAARDDLPIAGTGDDHLIGGLGADTFVVGLGDRSDQVFDFASEDRTGVYAADFGLGRSTA